MGDIDFRVEHTGVSARQRAGTLERVVKYEPEAFSAAWDYLASSGSETSFLFFFPGVFFPWIRGEIRPFFGRLFFFRPLAHLAGCAKKKKRVSTRKKIASPKASDTPKSRCKHNRLYFCVGGGIILYTW